VLLKSVEQHSGKKKMRLGINSSEFTHLRAGSGERYRILGEVYLDLMLENKVTTLGTTVEKLRWLIPEQDWDSDELLLGDETRKMLRIPCLLDQVIEANDTGEECYGETKY
jgi:hypothetical protein